MMGEGHGGYRRQVRGQSQGNRPILTLRQGRAPLRRRAKVRLEKGRGIWMHGLKEREEIAGLTGSRARAMDPGIYPTVVIVKSPKCICKKMQYHLLIQYYYEGADHHGQEILVNELKADGNLLGLKLSGMRR
jgi:hypothetical protein